MEYHHTHVPSSVKNRTLSPESPIEELTRILPEQKKALRTLGLHTIRDLLYHFPTRYGTTAEVGSIARFTAGDHVTIFGKVVSMKTGKAFVKKMTMAEAVIDDGTGTIQAVWFHQPYIAKLLTEGSLVKMTGKVAARKSKGLYLTNPEFEKLEALPEAASDSLFTGNDVANNGHESEADDRFANYAFPVYPETKGVSSKWMYHTTERAFALGIHEHMVDPIPRDILERYNLPTLSTALVWIHHPKREKDALAARKRFAFEEIFFIQLQKQRDRKMYEAEPSFDITSSDEHMEQFTKRFPFPLTDAQKKAIADITADFKKGHPMGRLLEGDVGSGKTAVAAATAYAVVSSRPRNQNFGTLQVAYMAPTEILATQLYESFIAYFAHMPIQIALITGSGCRKFPSKINPSGWTDISRTQLLKWVASGEIAIVIGTQTLIQKTVEFKHLACVIIDEQHRFGINQRQKLAAKNSAPEKSGVVATSSAKNTVRSIAPTVPHLLSMTATPIPRTLALTIYGDLDLSVLDSMPLGRKPVQTEIVLPGTAAREKVYAAIRAELKTGRQAYVICPRINEPDPDKEKAVNAKSVTEEALRLERDIFPEFTIDIMHSKMTPDAKEKAMLRFEKGETDILVSTSVVEVGVNVPNATVMIIEGAERFGLAQLHQLRGRVMRGSFQPYCYVFAESKTKTTVERLKAFMQARNGFELAEYDLTQRGAGELSGGKQWGISDLAMEAIKNIKMVEAARKEAYSLIASDPTLTKHPLLKTRIEAQGSIHFE